MDSKKTVTVPHFDMTQEQREYFCLLIEDIAANGGFGDGDPVDIVRQAHARRQAFMLELLEGRTARARAAVAAMMGGVYLQLRSLEARRAKSAK